MRKLGKFLCEHSKSDFLPNSLWVDSLSMIPHGEKGKFDIVILGYVLQEISSAKTRQLVIEALWSRLKDDGVFVLIEPGSPKGFRFVHNFREWILTTKSREEANIVAPCPHQNECPMAKNPEAWCNFSQLTVRYPTDVFPKRPQER
jgi:ribosomal protein RSM22 (predicted rRNA methylase)